MRLFRGLFKKLLLIIILVGVILYFLQDQIMKVAIPYIVAKNSNVKVKIARVDSELQKGYLKLTGLVIINPEGFKKERLAEVNSLLLDLNLKKLLIGKIQLSKLFVDIATIYIIKNEKGIVNVSEIKKPGVKSAQKKKRKISIDKMHIRLGEVISIDYSRRPVRAKRIRLNLDKEFTNVTDVKKTLVPIFTQVVVNKTLYGIKEKLRLPDLNIF
jgi:uncharacterized protein involved in outer membrane biogenesis